MKRFCTSCNELKDNNEFPKRDQAREKKVGTCKVCINKACAASYKRRFEADPIGTCMKRGLKNKKAYCKSKGIPFDITYEDLLPLPEHCPILGYKLVYCDNPNPNGGGKNTASLDRIIPELGYVKNNVKIISMEANRIKDNLDIGKAEKILNYLKQNNPVPSGTATQP